MRHKLRRSNPGTCCRRPEPPPPAEPAPPVAALSYSSLGEYKRCGYRFYVERVLGLPPVDRPDGPREAVAGLAADRPRRPRPRPARAARLPASDQADGGDDLGSGAADRNRLAAQRRRRRGGGRPGGAFRCHRAVRAAGPRHPGRRGRSGSRSCSARRAVVGALDVLAREPGGPLAGRRLQDRSARGRGSARGGRSRPTRPSGSCTRWRRCAPAPTRSRSRTCSSTARSEPVTATFSREDAPELEDRLAALADGVHAARVRRHRRAASRRLSAAARPRAGCARGRWA